MKIFVQILLIAISIAQVSCGLAGRYNPEDKPYVPAEEFSRKHGGVLSYQSEGQNQVEGRARLSDESNASIATKHNGFQGDPKYTKDGFKLKKTFQVTPVQQTENDSNNGGPAEQASTVSDWQVPRPPVIPAGSSAPYYNGQMTPNPSLWNDESEGAFAFDDFRALHPMDVITVTIKETTRGNKKAETDAKSEYSLVAGIKSLFGWETKTLAANNTSLDPTSLISASTEAEFKGDGETKREGSLIGTISAVIMERMPNGLLRIEGTKIVSLNDEEEVMVLSGLVRTRDITATNEIDSSRIANMRIDFYGRGLVSDHNAPGWGTKLFEKIWPF
jgi:flagellar L-ring protein precursor FlgH